MVASSGSLEVVEFLIKKNADMNSTDSSGAKPIHMAAKEGHRDVLEYFLSLGVSVDERGENDWTLMHYAAAENHSGICKFLSERGADVNAVSKGGTTPLHVAAEKGKLDAVLTLLEIGAFYDRRDENNRTPLEITEWMNTRIKISLIFASNMISAVQSNNRFKLVGLLMAGLDILKFNFVNVKNAENTASIHYAAWKGYERIVNILLRNKANPNSRTKNNCTALHYAAKFSHYGIVKDFLCNGAIFDAISASGKTPLQFSSNADVVTILELLKNTFLKIENKDRSILEDLKAIKDMDIAKAVVRAKNLQGRTMISVAILNNHPDIDDLKEIFQTDVLVPLKMAEKLYRHGNYEESFNLYQVVLQKRGSIFHLDDPAVLEIQKQLASFLIYYQDYNAALSLAQKVYQTMHNILGDRNKETLTVQCLIALTLECTGQEQQALKIYEDVSNKQREVLGLNHKETLATLTSMAELLYKENEFEMALKVNEEIFKTLNEYYEISPWTLRVQTNIAMILRKQEKFTEALETFRNISEAKEKLFGSNHQETLGTSTEIAVTLLCMGQEEESLKLHRRNVELQIELLGLAILTPCVQVQPSILLGVSPLQSLDFNTILPPTPKEYDNLQPPKENGQLNFFNFGLTLELSCAMKFEAYPHDTQTCSLKMESLSYTTDDLVFDWESQVPLVVEPTIELPQHILVDTKLGDCMQEYSTGNFTCIEVMFTLERRLGYYLFHTYIPTCLIVIMSWISFWIRADAVPARVTLCVTSLLTLATQHAQSQKSLPPVSYIKAIDIFMSTCTLFVFSSLMEYAIVNIVMGQAEDRERMANSLLNDVQLIRVEGDSRMPNGTKVARSPTLHRRSESLERQALKIDKFSRIVFPALFVVLNVAYWSYYLR
ncbi:Glycine receptor subunit alpha-2 like protein [Argiope bruennichi]|uniref:Alpha-latrotoxin n=2 Tax=Araneidae TaxID=6913 RepID=A0A8T0EG60_ARGBR|nr:Glycine receptor subunit alpha-2 like protein [Argiope bruennichi]